MGGDQNRKAQKMDQTQAAIDACKAAIRQNPDAAARLFPLLPEPQTGFLVGGKEYYFSALGIINASLRVAGLDRISIKFDETGKPIDALRYKRNDQTGE